MFTRNIIIGFLGTLGTLLSVAMGGFDHTVFTLFILMAIDFGAGIICAAVFKASTKSESGALTSDACFRGICRKGMIILIVIISARLDIETGSTYIRDGVCIAFITSEAMSIIETAGLMGIPIPRVIKSALEALKKREEKYNENT